MLRQLTKALKFAIICVASGIWPLIITYGRGHLACAPVSPVRIQKVAASKGTKIEGRCIGVPLLALCPREQRCERPAALRIHKEDQVAVARGPKESGCLGDGEKGHIKGAVLAEGERNS